AVAEALHHAHSHGITHRDIKPSNILLDSEDRAHLADFGLLRTFHNDTIIDAAQPRIEGTVPYMSPAVAAGKAEDTRCDIYAFGCLLYEMLTGRPPYQGATVDAILKQIQDGPPPPVRQLNPQAPANLTAIAEHAMARELRDRYATMGDVVADLERAASGKEPIGPHGREMGSSNTRKVMVVVGIMALVALAAFGISRLPFWKSSGNTDGSSTQNTTRVAPAGKIAAGTGKVIDLGGGVTMEFVLIQPGSFMMGSDEGTTAIEGVPVHKVTLTKPYGIGKYEVTQEQWEKIMGANPSYFQGPKNPVDSVTWNDCQSFVAKLNAKAPGRSFRLPTEAEWEYACRAGSTAAYCFREGKGSLADYAWSRSNADNTNHPVGQKKPNAWGLHDMHGNVVEWCADRYGEYPASAVTDPQGPSSGSRRVLRGSNNTFRFWDRQEVTANSSGVRLVLNAVPGDGEIKSGSPPQQGTDANQSPVPPAAERTPGEEMVIILPGGVKMKLVWIPATTSEAWKKISDGRDYFVMGSPSDEPGRAGDEDQVKVKLSQGFWLAQTECTQNQWVAIMANNPSGFKGDDLPVEQVSWNDAKKFITKFNEVKTLPAGWKAHLPTEAQWEYACRAGTKTIYSFGDSLKLTSANFGGTLGKTCPVANYPANAWGLYDMHGNVWEWCADGFGGYPSGLATDPFGPKNGASHPFRGGSYCDDGMECRSANRAARDAPWRWNTIGFRVVLVAMPDQTGVNMPTGTILDEDTFTYAVIDGAVTIMAYTGTDDIATIPAKIYNLPVTGIGDRAFAGCTGLINITIPNSVTRIGAEAFSGCSGLISIMVDDANPAYGSSADGVLFDKKKTSLLVYPGGKAGNYAIPSGVTKIGSSAFANCTKLTGITIPGSVTYVEPNAFVGCGKQDTIVVDAANPVYSSSADGVLFNKEKTKLVRCPTGMAGSYVVPDSVTSIEDQAFSSCTNLTDVTIPASVVKIC
ncbi:MAG: SUMF1/EgtB/PvdO family nonheme iron enzyme, partial [Verrucomicrobiota bacterium]